MTEWVRAGEAAEILGVSSSRIRQLSLAGRLRHKQTPMGRIYRRTAIEALAEERRVSADGRPS